MMLITIDIELHVNMFADKYYMYVSTNLDDIIVTACLVHSGRAQMSFSEIGCTVNVTSYR